jgi:hypothetical protein
MNKLNDKSKLQSSNNNIKSSMHQYTTINYTCNSFTFKEVKLSFVLRRHETLRIFYDTLTEKGFNFTETEIKALNNQLDLIEVVYDGEVVDRVLIYE